MGSLYIFTHKFPMEITPNSIIYESLLGFWQIFSLVLKDCFFVPFLLKRILIKLWCFIQQRVTRGNLLQLSSFEFFYLLCFFFLLFHLTFFFYFGVLTHQLKLIRIFRWLGVWVFWVVWTTIWRGVIKNEISILRKWGFYEIFFWLQMKMFNFLFFYW